MTRKFKKYYLFVLVLIVVGCANGVEDSELPPEPDCMNCNDIFLDPMYNHFYTEDRTEPFTGNCKGYNGKGAIILEKSFIEGKIEGAYLEYYDDGTLKSSWNFLKNKQHGDTKGYNPDGSLQYHVIYYKGDVDSSIYP